MIVRRTVRLLGAAAVACTGCAGYRIGLPGDPPPPPGLVALVSAEQREPLPPPAGRAAFDLPPELPGADAPPVVPPRFGPNTSAAERAAAVRKVYPEPSPLPPPPAETGPAVSLADLTAAAMAKSPVLRRAKADAEAAYGQVVQAGLAPNPTVGYQGDQMTPGPRRPINNAGQQGAFLNQLVKFPGKLSLARAVAGFDYLNATVAARRAEVDVTTAVRTAYFAAVVARQGVEVNRALVTLADEVYRIQLGRLTAGVATGYEPLLLYAQASQARNALSQAEATHRAAWKQLAAAVGDPDMPPAPLAGRADCTGPAFDPDELRAYVRERHTDVLTALNSQAQAHVNLKLQRLTPVPDLATNVVVQHDNALGLNQFNLQLGLPLPVFDRNQGNIRQATWQVARATANVEAVRNDLLGRLAEAVGRYEGQRATAERYREQVLPNLARAYKAVIRQYQVDTEKVGFNDIVLTQQNLGTALQAYLAALDAQWRAAVDVANLGQLDGLEGCPPVNPAKP